MQGLNDAFRRFLGGRTGKDQFDTGIKPVPKIIAQPDIRMEDPPPRIHALPKRMYRFVSGKGRVLQRTEAALPIIKNQDVLRARQPFHQLDGLRYMLTPRTDRKRRIKAEHGDSPLAGHRKRKNGKAKRGLRLAKHRGKPAATDHERLLTRRKEHAGHVFPYQDEVVDIKILFVAQQSQKKEPSQQCSPQKGLIRVERMKEGVGVPKDGGLIGPGNEQSTL